MNNKQLVSLFFGLGFLVLVAGIFSTGGMTLRQGNMGVRPQNVSGSRTNTTAPNVVNDTTNNIKIDTNNANEKIKTALNKVDGVDNTDVVVANKCALISCNVSNTLKNQSNYKDILTKKVKEIDPTITMVYIMENDKMNNMNFETVSKEFTSMTTNDFKAFWDKMMNGMNS